METATKTSVGGMRWRARMRVGKLRYATALSFVQVMVEDRTSTAMEAKHLEGVRGLRSIW